MNPLFLDNLRYINILFFHLILKAEAYIAPGTKNGYPQTYGCVGRQGGGGVRVATEMYGKKLLLRNRKKP